MKVEFKGLDKLQKKLREIGELRKVQEVVKVNTTEMHAKATRNASFKGHYNSKGEFIKPTGATKRSIETEFKDGGLTGTVRAGTSYSPYLEFGTRYMDSQPFIRPAFYKQRVKYMQDLRKILKSR